MKLGIIKKLFSPLDYLRIKHEEKIVIDLYLPSILSVFVVFAFWSLPGDVVVFGGAGIIGQINGLLQVLIGFYIAALAAVSTFQARGMDALMEGEPPTLREIRKGVAKNNELSRRRFLCFLFGYLALASFFAFSLGLIANVLAPIVKKIDFFIFIWPYIAIPFSFFYALIIFNLLITTMLGLYYLTVKIHIQRHEEK